MSKHNLQESRFHFGIVDDQWSLRLCNSLVIYDELGFQIDLICVLGLLKRLKGFDLENRAHKSPENCDPMIWTFFLQIFQNI